MYLYNVTVNVDLDIEEEWLQWIKDHHIPAVLESGMFVDNQLYRLLHDPHNDGSTYSIQFFARSIDHIDTYLTKFAPTLMEKHNERYRNKHVAFQTVLEFVPQ